MTSRPSLDKNKSDKRLGNRLHLSESNEIEAKMPKLKGEKKLKKRL